MSNTDTIDKLVSSYFAAVSKEDFSYKKRIFLAKPLQISPLLLRGYSCPENCGGCCLRFSLDYLPTEVHPYLLSEREIFLNEKRILIFSDKQENNLSKHCCNVDNTNGRCKIHGKHLFSCDFELIRCLIYKEKNHPNNMIQRLYGRGWNMLRIDDKRGALCEMTSITKDSTIDVVRKLKRLLEWTNHFNLNTWIPEIINAIESKKLKQKIVFSNKKKRGLIK